MAMTIVGADMRFWDWKYLGGDKYQHRAFSYEECGQVYLLSHDQIDSISRDTDGQVSKILGGSHSDGGVLP